MRKKHLLLLLLLLCMAPVVHGKMTIDMGMAVENVAYYTFPNLTVTPDESSPEDRVYSVRIMFTRVTGTGDKIVYPSTPGGWTRNDASTQYIVVYDVLTGATADQVQAALRTVQFTLTTGKRGQAVVVMLSHENNAGRRIFYSSELDKWYEHVVQTSAIDWVKAYNEAHGKTLMGMTGHLATVTSTAESKFIISVAAGAQGWIGGTRFDIKTVMQEDGTLSGKPTAQLNYWYWADGPEWTGKGTTPYNSRFYSAAIKAQGTSANMPFEFNYWNSAQPDAAQGGVAGGEQSLQLLTDGSWNDLPYTHDIKSYVVEYEGETYDPNNPSSKDAVANGEYGFANTLEAFIDGTPGNGTSEAPVQIVLGDEVLYKITAVNSLDIASTVTVVNTLPTGMEYVDGSADNGGTYENGAITWTLPLAVEGSATLTFKAKKAEGATGLMVNTPVIRNEGRDRNINSTFHTGVMATVSFTAGAGGTVSGDGQNIDYGLKPTEGVTYNANAGYDFTGWSYPAYTSLKNEQKPGGSGITEYTTISVLGNMTLTANFTAIPYKVTVGGEEFTGDYNVGDEVPITAPEPPAGQVFVRWEATPEVEFDDATDPNTSFEMPAEAVTITPIYDTAYEVTVTGGTAGRAQAAKGQTVGLTLTPSADAGKEFYRWESDEVEIRNARDESGASFVMIAGAVNVTAVYRNESVTLDDLVDDGLATKDGDTYTLKDDYIIPEDGGLEIGDGQTLIVPEDTKLDNKGVLENEGTIDNKGDIANEGIIHNEGELKGNKPTAESTEPGKGTVEHTGEVTLDELVASGDAVKTGDNTYTLTGDYDVVVGSDLVVKDNQTLIIPDGKTLGVPDDAKLSIPPTATLTNDGQLTNNGVLANEGTINNKGGMENNGKYEGAGELDHTGEVTLEELVLSGDATKDESGDNYTLKDDYTVPPGSELVIDTEETLIVPEDKTLTVPEETTLSNKGTLTNNGEIKNDGTVVIVDEATMDGDGEVTGDGKIVNKSTSFIITATVEANVGGTISLTGGTITPEGKTVIAADEDAEFTFLPADGYVIAQVLIDGVSTPKAAAAGKYTFENVAKAHTISVIFATIEYVFYIQTEVGAGGTIDPLGKVPVYRGAAEAFYFLPDEGYIVDKVVVDGEEVTEDDLRKDERGLLYCLFKGVVAHHTISVTFRPDPATGNAEVEEAAFRVWTADGQLFMSGLTPGESWSVYNMVGVIVAQGTATGSEVTVALPAHGFYIVKAGTNTVKVMVND
jgi:uncharacterized repeat protein (TIGR01451 family)